MNKFYSRVTEKGIQSLYAEINGNVYFLFSQNYRVGVKDYFSKGVRLDKMLEAKKHNNIAVRHTAVKLISAIKALEKECNIVIFNKKFESKNPKSYNKYDRRFNKYSYMEQGA